MEIKTQYFGTIPYSEGELIHFSDGLFGFSHLKNYVPLAFQDNSDAMISLQSIDDDRISFILMNPFQLYSEYTPVLSADDSSMLKASYDEKNISYYVICVIHDNMDESTVNLKAPIAVNTDTREAKQIILDNPLYKFRHPIKDFMRREK
ncbi:flagellar assembly protein FliW [Clostridium boliviensis]|uniref:Flagellar assembly factor FliW n=1 Tax=Clostridium boliviensis TaxID=318465 RepID=A0ABU4GM65_9CLOT|nr:flagellar assembly protein FliW [Clostridium boliviensis]MDW2798112.1 flagellar assembly protein FliW [Clostridium boliviensis]